MERTQIVLDKTLLRAIDQAARRPTGSAPPWYETRCANTYRDSKSELEKNATAKAISSTPLLRLSRGVGSGGRVASRIARGNIPLYEFAPPDKKRPVLVLTRHSAISNLSTVTVSPITSTIREMPSEVVLSEEDGMKRHCAVNLHNAVTISQDRLGRRVGRSQLLAHEPGLRGLALLSGLRFQFIQVHLSS